MVYRAMGAKIGKRVYWPGSGIYCLDPELLEVGDDVVFGSRSQLLTTDSLGSEKIIIGNGGKVSSILHRRLKINSIFLSAMIADRVVLLPGTRIGNRTVMGTGALGKRNGTYEDGSTWIGNGMHSDLFTYSSRLIMSASRRRTSHLFDDINGCY